MQALKFSIAIVEEDEGVRLGICTLLQKLGISAWGARSTDDFYAGLLLEHIDWVFADSNVIADMSTQKTPKALLTLRGDLGLHAAADHVSSELLHCFVHADNLHAMVKHFAQQLVVPFALPQGGFLSWQLDHRAAHLIAPNHHFVTLTGRELDLLDCLMSRDLHMVSKQALLEVMGYTRVDNGFHRIESQLARLRRKTLQATGLPLPIRAVFGRGLVFVAQRGARSTTAPMHHFTATSQGQSM